MWLNARATCEISSRPISGARAAKSPAPRRSAADSSATSRRRAGPKITKAATTVVATSSRTFGTDRKRAASRNTPRGPGGGMMTTPRSSPCAWIGAKTTGPSTRGC
jgi:hypothetical protein